MLVSESEASLVYIERARVRQGEALKTKTKKTLLSPPLAEELLAGYSSSGEGRQLSPGVSYLHLEGREKGEGRGRTESRRDCVEPSGLGPSASQTAS